MEHPACPPAPAARPARRCVVVAIAAVFGSACAGSRDAARTESAEPSGTSPAPRTEVTEPELETLRANVTRLLPGTPQREALAALGVSLDGLGVAGTGPTHESTAIYRLRGTSVLWLTWDARDPHDIVLVRAVVWDEAHDPVPPAPPYPPPPR